MSNIAIQSLVSTSNITAMIDGIRVSVDFAFIDPERAASWLDHDLYADQRKLRSHHVTFLSEAILGGRFRTASKVEFVHYDDQWHLVDGQHTAAAIKKSGVGQTLIVVRRWVSTLDELAKIYATFGRELQRTPADVMKGLRLGKEFDMNDQQLNAFYAAVKLPLNNFRALTQSSPVIGRDVLFISEEMRGWVPAANGYFAAIADATPLLKRSLIMAPVMGVGLATFKERAHHAATFWTNVSTGEGQFIGDPAKALREYLIAIKGHGSAVYRAKTVANCWNKFFRNDKMTKATPADMRKAGVTIRGTNYRAVAVVKATPKSWEEESE